MIRDNSKMLNSMIRKLTNLEQQVLLNIKNTKVKSKQQNNNVKNTNKKIKVVPVKYKSKS